MMLIVFLILSGIACLVLRDRTLGSLTRSR